MRHSTLTQKGQTTITGKIRKPLKMKAGGRLEYSVSGDCATIRVHPGLLSLGGSLASDKGKGPSIAEIRRKAAENYWRKHMRGALTRDVNKFGLGSHIHQRFAKLGGVELKLLPRTDLPRTINFDE